MLLVIHFLETQWSIRSLTFIWRISGRHLMMFQLVVSVFHPFSLMALISPVLLKKRTYITFFYCSFFLHCSFGVIDSFFTLLMCWNIKIWFVHFIACYDSEIRWCCPSNAVLGVLCRFWCALLFDVLLNHGRYTDKLIFF